MINTKNLPHNKIKVDKKASKTILYYIGYVTVKDLRYTKFNNVDSLSFVMNKTMRTSKKAMGINI